MKPVPVPGFVRRSPWVEGTQTFGAPDGFTDAQIPPAEGLFYTITGPFLGEETVPAVGVVLELDDSEVAAIRNGARHILLSWAGRQMPVFIVPEVLQRVPGGEA